MARKNQINNQFGRTSETGLRTIPATGPDLGLEPLVDLNGRLWVNVVGISPVPDPFPLTGNESSAIAATSAGTIINAGNSRLDILSGYVRGTTTTPFWFHIFNQTTLPILGDIPVVILPLEDFQLEFSKAQPKTFSVGIVIAPSTTELTFTAFTAPIGVTFMFEASYSLP